MHKGAKFRQIGNAKQFVCVIFLKKVIETNTRYENNYYWSQKEKNYLATTGIIHGLYEEKSLIKISLIQDSSTEKRLFMLLPTLISTIALTDTFFDIKNSFKVKSSLAKVNFLLKMYTLDVSTTEKVTNIIHQLDFNQNQTSSFRLTVILSQLT